MWQCKKLIKPKIQEGSNYNLIKNVRNLFKLKQKNKTIKDKIINDVRSLFKLENEDYYKQIRVSNFHSKIKKIKIKKKVSNNKVMGIQITIY